MSEFRFYTSAKIVEITGRRARTLEELLAGIRELDGSVIFHHTHHFILRHQYLVPEPPNDFAQWVEEALQERDLAERLQSINTVEFGTIRALRDRLAAVIEAHLKKRPYVLTAPEDRVFHFLRTRTIVFPTPYIARDLAEFRHHLEQVSLDSIYHHMFEARLRLERGTNDFSMWLENELGEAALAKSIARLDPYSYTLEALRRVVMVLVDRRMKI